MLINHITSSICGADVPKRKGKEEDTPNTRQRIHIILMQLIQPSDSWYDVFWTDVEILSIFIFIFIDFH